MSFVVRLQRPTESGWVSRCWAAIIAVYAVVPVVMVVIMAFTDGQFLDFPPAHFSIRWFDSIARSMRWRHAFESTLRLAILASSLSTLLALSATLGLRGYRSKMTLRTIIMLPLIVPLIVTAFALVPFYTRVGLLGSVGGLVIVHALIALPFAFSVLADSAQSIDSSLERAAQSLGASWGYRVWRITLPLLLPGLISAFIVSTVVSFDEVTATLFLSHPSTRTVPIEIWIALGQDFSPRAASASVIILAMNIAALSGGGLLSRWVASRGRK